MEKTSVKNNEKTSASLTSGLKYSVQHAVSLQSADPFAVGCVRAYVCTRMCVCMCRRERSTKPVSVQVGNYRRLPSLTVAAYIRTSTLCVHLVNADNEGRPTRVV